MSAMSGLPISAFEYGRSARSTWLLLTGTAISPASTPEATLTCAAAGEASARALADAAASAPHLKCLAAISPHLHLVALRPPDDLDVIPVLGRRGAFAHGRLRLRHNCGRACDGRGHCRTEIPDYCRRRIAG